MCGGSGVKGGGEGEDDRTQRDKQRWVGAEERVLSSQPGLCCTKVSTPSSPSNTTILMTANRELAVTLGGPV